VADQLGFAIAIENMWRARNIILTV